jgi:hypothetical protein
LFSSSSQTSHEIPLILVITHQNPFVFINFPLFPSSSCNFPLFSTQHYINPHKALNFGINTFFCNLKTWILRWCHGEKKKKKEKWLTFFWGRNTVRVQCAVRKWLWRMCRQCLKN